MSESTAERLRGLLAERFKLKPERVELHEPLPTQKWRVIARVYPYDIFVTAYKDGRIRVDSGPVCTKEGIRSALYLSKYKYREWEARGEEEKEMIWQKELEERERILEDFKQRKYEKYLKRRSIAYHAELYMWADEIAKRMSGKYGFDVKFEIDSKSDFVATFDSTGMNDEQLINEAMRRVDAMAEAGEMFENEEMMNEFLASRGIEIEKPRRRRCAS